MNEATTLAATPIEGALIPEVEAFIDGKWWLRFKSDGTFSSYKAMPNAVRFGSRCYIKAGWNSDTCTISYKEGRFAMPESVMAPLAG